MNTRGGSECYSHDLVYYLDPETCQDAGSISYFADVCPADCFSSKLYHPPVLPMSPQGRSVQGNWMYGYLDKIQKVGAKQLNLELTSLSPLLDLWKSRQLTKNEVSRAFDVLCRIPSTFEHFGIEQPLERLNMDVMTCIVTSLNPNSKAVLEFDRVINRNLF